MNDGLFKYAQKAKLQSDVQSIKEFIELKKALLFTEDANILEDGEHKNLEEMSSILNLPNNIIEKYGNKMIVGKKTGDTTRLYYNSNYFTDENEKRWLEEIDVNSWSQDFTGKYTISNLLELQQFRDKVNAGTFTGCNNDNTAYLIADIDMKDEINWTPIGENEETAFKGTFIGNSYKIKNINIESTSPNTGLFGYNKGKIDSIIIESGAIKGSSSNLGAICGLNDSEILNCVNKITVTNTNAEATSIGGIVGYASQNSIIKNCKNYGNIFGVYKLVGGICGYSFGKINGCSNNGSISSTNDGQVGGIVGDSQSETAIVTRCHNIGYISGIYQIGGICGCLYNSKATENYNIGGITGTDTVGGVIGHNLNESVVERSFNCGNVKATNWVGGVCGAIQENSKTIDCYNTGSVMGETRTGGVSGLLWDTSNLINCFNVGSVSGSEKGALVGRYQTSVQNCYYSEGSYVSNSCGDMKTDNEMKSDVVELLDPSGEIWKKDTNNINYGYPVLAWQNNALNIYNNQTYMPNMIGITAYCDSEEYENGTEWRNNVGLNNIQIQGTATKSSDGSVILSGGSSSYASIDVGKTDNRTIYVIAKCNNETVDIWDPIVTSAITKDNIYHALDTFSYNNKIVGSSIVNDIFSEKSSLDYTVVAIVSNAYNSKYKLYVNGEYIGEETAYHTYRNNMMYLNAIYRNNMKYSANSVSYKFLAVSGIMQTEEQILQNSTWLMNKYNIK